MPAPVPAGMTGPTAPKAPQEPQAMSALTLLLPPRSRFDGQPLPAGLGKALGRGDRLPDGQGGWRAQLQRHIGVLPRGWPVAAVTRQLDAGDAALNAWLRADPAHVRADIGTGRMLACGDLDLSLEEAQDFLRPLMPLFGDAGYPISAPVPDRWYLMLPREARLPPFAEPEDVLGDDLCDHLPAGDGGRRWRALLNEAQVILHNHPRNAGRVAAGKLPVNSLWFWGGGVLPDHVELAATAVFTREAQLAGFARLAGVRAAALPAAFAALADVAGDVAGEVLVDLRGQRDLAALERDWLAPAQRALGKAVSELVLDFADGAAWRLTGGQRWRIWRRPATLAG
jgi:hypothetical protein